MVYCFDLDNTLCFSEGNNYMASTPNNNMIKKVNHLYDNGHTIKIFTARGMTTYNGSVSSVYMNMFILTSTQLNNWGIKYHELIMGKPSFDIFIDDKNITIEEFKSMIIPVVGFIAGAFDLIHPGYIKMFKEIKNDCEYLIIGLHEDPSIERNKPKPILSPDERKDTLLSIKYIDEVKLYKTEKDLYDITEKLSPNILFLGDDYINVEHNGLKLGIETHYINRDHGWSTTKLKQEIIKNYV